MSDLPEIKTIWAGKLVPATRIKELEQELQALRESKYKYITELSQQLTLASKNALNLAKQHKEDEARIQALREIKGKLTRTVIQHWDYLPLTFQMEWQDALLGESE